MPLQRHGGEQWTFGSDGLQKTTSPVEFLLGDEAEILAHLKELGFSEEQIEAFKSGKALIATILPTPFGQEMVDHAIAEEKLKKK